MDTRVNHKSLKLYLIASAKRKPNLKKCQKNDISGQGHSNRKGILWDCVINILYSDIII